MDPPYYANVMYAELSDFFYVWLKRTAGMVVPGLFLRKLAEKDREAIANKARFQGQKRAALLAERDYRERMAAIFSECRRVLKPDGVMTLMFTHKATGAWDALTSGLMEGGFTITASWPVNTEAEASLHIREKSAANSTIFLVCRPRQVAMPGAEPQYWEDVERLVAASVRQHVEEFQKSGIRGVDLYLASFGPALQEFAAHWPLRRGQPRKEATARRKAQIELFPEYADPYAVTPEDALDAARREVKRWRLSRLTRSQRDVEVDRMTEWFVLAWDAFKAPVVDYDEALHLARVVGLDLDRDVVGAIAEKKGSDLVLLDSARRAAKHWLGPADGGRSMLDALHHAAYAARSRGTGAAREQLEQSGIHKDPAFRQALLAVLEVLPVGKSFTKLEEEPGPGADAASDFDALETLRRLLLAGEVPRPKQLDLWEAPAR
jgi:adenine-specific DNA methylase